MHDMLVPLIYISLVTVWQGLVQEEAFIHQKPIF